MLTIVVEAEAQTPRVVAVDESPCRIGRHRDCTVVLPSWRVGRLHAELRRNERAWTLVDLGTLGGTFVNGERVVEYGPLADDDEIQIAGFRLRVASCAQDTDEARPADGDATAHGADPAVADGTPAGDAVRVPPATLDARRTLHRKLLARLDLRRQEIRHLSATALRLQLAEVLAELLEADPSICVADEREQLIATVIDEAVGLGPLEQLLADDSVTEIMVNGTESVFVEREGRLQRTALSFSSAEAIRSVIDRIVAPLGRRIDEASPMVDGRLADGSRVNAVIPPLAIRGPTITIRRFSAKVFEPADLLALGSISAPMLEFLTVCVRTRRNIIVSGGTGSGKTTLLNVLSNLIDPAERIITIEDAAELKLRHPHLVSLESRPPNIEGRGQIAIRDLVRNALRMRPDRIIVGECRGGEALDMLQAMNTGHDGSLTTVHANSPRDVMARLEVMVLMSGVEIPVGAIREQVASAIDVVVQQARLADGSRRIVEIAEVTGIEAGRVQLLPLFRFEPGIERGARGGRFTACGQVPAFYESLARSGRVLDLEIFADDH